MSSKKKPVKKDKYVEVPKKIKTPNFKKLQLILK